MSWGDCHKQHRWGSPPGTLERGGSHMVRGKDRRGPEERGKVAPLSRDEGMGTHKVQFHGWDEIVHRGEAKSSSTNGWSILRAPGIMERGWALGTAGLPFPPDLHR